MSLDAFFNGKPITKQDAGKYVQKASEQPVQPVQTEKPLGFPIRITVEGEWVRVAFPYHRRAVDFIKEMPGRKYDPATCTWLFPKIQWKLFQANQAHLCFLVGQNVSIQVTPEDLALLNNSLEFKWSAIQKVDGFIGDLYPFQGVGAGFLVERKRALLADEMGLGKSIQTIAACLELRRQGAIKRVLVFCPKTIIQQWVAEFKRFTGEKACAVMGSAEERNRKLAHAHGYFFVATNYETVLRNYKELASLKPDLVVVDEAQRIGSYDAKTTKIIKTLFRSPYRFALTGTPLENSLAELYSIMDWIDEGVLGSWWDFSKRYLIVDENKHVRGSRNLVELHMVIKDWMLRRRKSEVLQDLPPLTVNNYYITLCPEERKLYKQIKTDLKMYYQLYKGDKNKQKGALLSQLMYMRECCDHLALVSKGLTPYTGRNSKLTELQNVLSDIGNSPDSKTVIFTEFERMLHIISKNIHVDHELLYGAMDQNHRINAINRFKTDPKCNVFISTSAGDTGLNLQAASVIINYDIHWNPAKLQQRIGRLHRIGQKQTVTCINLITKDTIEDRILRVLSEKTLLFRKVIDGDFSAESSEGLIWEILADEFKEEEIWGL